MNNEVKAPNLDDPFEAHAYWALAFICDGCPAALDFPEGPRQFSRAWFENMASDAHKAGWTVEDPGGFKHYFDCYCPQCATTSQKKREPIQITTDNSGAAPLRV